MRRVLLIMATLSIAAIAVPARAQMFPRFENPAPHARDTTGPTVLVAPPPEDGMVRLPLSPEPGLKLPRPHVTYPPGRLAGQHWERPEYGPLFFLVAVGLISFAVWAAPLLE